MAQVTFNRELGAAPAGITRFGQYRSEDGGNVTVNSTVEDTSEGTFKRSDKYGVTSGVTGTGTVTLQAGSMSVKRVFIMSGIDGSILGEVNSPKMSNRTDVSFEFSVGGSIENYLYVEKTDRSPCVYRVTYTAAWSLMVKTEWTMSDPSDWECSLAKKIKESMEEGNRTSSSYYVSIEETVSRCERKAEDPDGQD